MEEEIDFNKPRGYKERIDKNKTIKKVEIPPLTICRTPKCVHGMPYDSECEKCQKEAQKKQNKPFSVEEKAHNNGGSTDYYKFEPEWVECGDIIEARKMNYNQGNIFKSAFCFNVGRHNGTDYERELNKIVYFAERELKRIKNVEA